MKLILKQFLIVLCSVMFFGGHQTFAATFIVNSDGAGVDADLADGTCETSTTDECTLHAAIQEANIAPGSTIQFSGQFTIIACSLPPLTGGQTTIDAHDQWDAIYDEPGVDLRSTYVCTGDTNLLTIDSDDNHIYGLYFQGWIAATNGIKITANGQNNTIGTDTAATYRNVFAITRAGVEVQPSATNNIISSNYFGTVDGLALAWPLGEYGLLVNGSSNQISNNVIVGQSVLGIYLVGSDNIVKSNIIGIDIYSRHALPNKDGIVIESVLGNEIRSNTISGNSRYGVWLNWHTSNNDIHHNKIGTYNQYCANQSHGVYISTDGANIIRSNDIRFNQGSGIYAPGPEATSLTIQGNTVSGNKFHGIHFGLAATGIIGGDTSTTMRNIIYNNYHHGIYLEGSSSVTVSGNFIGTTGPGNRKCGILLDSGANGNTIGGSSAVEGNWIAQSHEDGIKLSGSATTNNTFKNNVLGEKDPDGIYTTIANKYNGIYIHGGAHHNIIGSVGAGNTIVANIYNGIMIHESDNNLLVGNKIGVSTNNDPYWNYGNIQNGIFIIQSEGTVISANEIANNGSSSSNAGIKIGGSSAINNRISENSIYNNEGEGIILESGANASIEPPVISRNGQTLTGTTCPNCTVEIFSDLEDEGRFFEASVAADAAGEFSWTGDFQSLFTTATTTNSTFNTSMFSTPIRTSFPWVMFMPAILDN